LNSSELNERFFKWTNAVLDIIATLPKSKTNDVISYQLTKSSTSAGANYRAACRPKSRNDMINKLKIVEEELDESMYWLELIKHREPQINIESTYNEANELLSIIVASINTLKRKS